MARKAAAKRAPSTRQKQPLTADLLLRIYNVLDLNTRAKGGLQRLRDWALTLTAYRSFLRRGELAALRVEDVSPVAFEPDDPSTVNWPRALLGTRLLVIRVRSSKTAPTGRKRAPELEKGDTVIVGPHADPRLCPVRWCDTLRTALIAADKLSHYFFPDLNDKLKPLSGSSVSKAVKRLVGLIGLNPSHFAAHSTRRGAATDAFKEGIDVALIKRMGRWKSDAVYVYFDDVTGDMLRFNTIFGKIGRGAARPENPLPSASSASAGGGGGGGADGAEEDNDSSDSDAGSESDPLPSG